MAQGGSIPRWTAFYRRSGIVEVGSFRYSRVMTLQIFTLRERPDLRPVVFSHEFESLWPEFMGHDVAAKLYFEPTAFDSYLDYAFAVIAAHKVVARAFSVPFAVKVDGRTELPDGGWDAVIRWAHEERARGRAPTAVSALEINLLPQARGGGNSLLMLDAMKTCAKAKGFKICSRLYVR